MTTFNKDNFEWDGMYLTYDGDQGEHGKKFEDVYGKDRIHPSRIGDTVPMFIARFKRGSKPYKTWINFIVKNFTVEQWVELEKTTDDRNPGGMSPVAIMRTKGFMETSEKKLCKKYGLTPTVENWGKAVNLSWNRAA